MRRKLTRHVALFAAATLIFLASSSLVRAAGVTNGGFETGDFTGWFTDGNTSIQDSSFGVGPTEGSFDALISSGRASGTTGSSDAVPISQIETDLSLTPGTLSSLGYVNGSVISQTIAVGANQKLTFDWNFLTDEFTDGTGNPDAGLFVVQPTGASLTLATPVNATQAAPAATGFDNMTGFQSGSYVFSAPGTFTIAFLALNYGDTTAPSALLVDDVALTSASGGGSAVPLPAALLVAPLGALLAGGCGLRIRHRLAAK